jgi:hypothetical protein
MSDQFQDFQQQQMRKQQEQTRKQQQETLRRQQMGAWMEQQKHKQAQEGREAAKPDRFADVEKEAAWLHQERAAGRLEEEQFRARLKDLMLQDENGVWWMVGQQSGEWYRHEGGQWVRASPPMRGGLAAVSYAPAAPVTRRNGVRLVQLTLVAGAVLMVVVGLLPALVITVVALIVLKLLHLW